MLLVIGGKIYLIDKGSHTGHNSSIKQYIITFAFLLARSRLEPVTGIADKLLNVCTRLKNRKCERNWIRYKLVTAIVISAR